VTVSQAVMELGTIVLGNEPLPAVLERVVHIAAGALPAVREVSVTLVADDRATTAAFTGISALALDERQYEDERGPCLDAAAAGQRIVVKDTSAEPRWPQFALTAAVFGIKSSLSMPLPVIRDVTGALNFYAAESRAFDTEAVGLAETFATHAAVAVANAHLYDVTAALADQMRQAMTSRAVIEQAKGIVMRDRRCTADEAFDALVELSQESHIKLRDIAEMLVDRAIRTS
jgi:GAF domain-containing protein